MKTVLTFLLLACPVPCRAETAPPSDCAVLEDLYTQTVRTLVEFPGLSPKRRASLSFTEGIEPSDRIRSITEAILSARGLFITEDAAACEYAIHVAITDARCGVVREGRVLWRYCALTVHVRCADSGGNILFACGREKSHCDSMPKSSLRTTDNAACFSRAAKRATTGGGPGTARILSFLVLSAALGYFAFR
jgi:hypothetical protein